MEYQDLRINLESLDGVISGKSQMGGIRFDPMLEEKGGWILGEALKHDVEMVDAVI